LGLGGRDHERRAVGNREFTPLGARSRSWIPPSRVRRRLRGSVREIDRGVAIDVERLFCIIASERRRQ